MLSLTITMRGTESKSAGCTGSTSTRDAGAIASSLRRPSMPNGQHGTRWSLNTPPGASKDGDIKNQKMFLNRTVVFTYASFLSSLVKILVLPELKYMALLLVESSFLLTFFPQLHSFSCRKDFCLRLPNIPAFNW